MQKKQAADIREMFNIAKTLHKKSRREETGLFLIEGRREIDLAAASGVRIVQVFDETNTSRKNLERISYRGELIAVAQYAAGNLFELTVAESPLIVVLDGLEKPGNIGAIIRTAEAAGVGAVLICGGAGDLTNPNLIRASLGAVFALPCYTVSASDALRWLEWNGIPVVAATPDAAMNYFEHDFTKAAAIVLGSEAEGVSKFWLDNASVRATIPMTGTVNSLNVSASAAVLIYEAVSRRTMNGHH